MSKALCLQKTNRTTGKRIRLSPGQYRKLCEYILGRDKWCVFCGTPYGVTPAHIINRSQGGNDSPNNIVCACTPCHDKFDQYKIALPEKTVEMLKNEPEQLTRRGKP